MECRVLQLQVPGVASAEPAEDSEVHPYHMHDMICDMISAQSQPTSGGRQPVEHEHVMACRFHFMACRDLVRHVLACRGAR